MDVRSARVSGIYGCVKQRERRKHIYKRALKRREVSPGQRAVVYKATARCAHAKVMSWSPRRVRAVHLAKVEYERAV